MPPFAALVVFGDSLSDHGNAGRSSDGPVWVEVLAERLGLAPLRPARLGGTNHAVGGARARGGPLDLRAQAAAHLAARRSGGGADPAALHVVWAGGNDLLAALQLPAARDRDAAALGAAEAVAAAVEGLAAAGAVRFLVPNLPDVGLAPAVRAAGAAWAAEARRLSLLFGEALERALAGAEERRGGAARIVRLDVTALAERVAADPAAAGFRDVATPCLGRPSCAGHLFWDHVHPTAAAHARLAAAAARALRALRAPSAVEP